MSRVKRFGDSSSETITDERALFTHALKLLARRDHSVHQVRCDLQKRFPVAPETRIDEVLQRLLDAGYLDDSRFAENHVRAKLERGRPRLAAELHRAGISARVVSRVLEARDWPSIAQAVEAKMKSLKVEPPLKPRDLARLSRALQRLGYDADEVGVELENLRS